MLGKTDFGKAFKKAFLKTPGLEEVERELDIELLHKPKQKNLDQISPLEKE